MRFLAATWTNLIAINYEIDPGVVADDLPYGTALDLYEDKLYVSLVAFQFQNTRVMGVKWPWHVNFEEINLRFYVKRTVGNELRRGVVFIKEIVPKPLITIMANSLFHENYETLPIRSHIQSTADQTTIEYVVNGHNKISFAYDPTQPAQKLKGLSEFILEHYWGYARVHAQKSVEYRVEHMSWHSLQPQDVQLDFDYAQVYGRRFSFLNTAKPSSVNFTKGSPVVVNWGRTL